MTIPEGTFIVGKKLMGKCPDCGKIVRIDKPVFGSLHVCRIEPWHVERRGDYEIGWMEKE